MLPHLSVKSMPSPEKLALLDSEDASISVAEARHLARKHMLVSALERMYELGMNPETKASDARGFLQFIVEFASEAQGTGMKTAGKLSPAAARLIAKMGMQQEKNEKDAEVGQLTAGRGLLSDEEEGERVHPGGTAGDGGPAKPEGSG